MIPGFGRTGFGRSNLPRFHRYLWIYTTDISPINDSYWSYHQLSYQPGAPPCLWGSTRGFLLDSASDEACMACAAARCRPIDNETLFWTPLEMINSLDMTMIIPI